MDWLYLLIAFLIGVACCFGVMFFQNKSNSTPDNVRSAAELKAVLAAQANIHVDTSLNILNDMDARTAELRAQLNAYQASLIDEDITQDESKSTFFGEHASVYLRNTVKTDKKPQLLVDNGAQPRDFSNNASGLFAGQAVSTEKTDK